MLCGVSAIVRQSAVYQGSFDDAVGDDAPG